MANENLFSKYLTILNCSVSEPNLVSLKNLIRSHLINIPFENVSKIHFKITENLEFIPSFEKYLEGITKYGFGGTCYSNNYYLHQLLKYLGYDVILCGADMNIPDAHIINVVKFNNREYLVDAGYAAPFYEPIPLFLKEDYVIKFGIDKYVLEPRDETGNSRLFHYKRDELKHGYTIKPISRSITEFNHIIKSSFDPSSLFMNCLLLVKYGANSAKSFHNFSFISIDKNGYEKEHISTPDKLIARLVSTFHIPQYILKGVIKEIKEFRDVWK